MISNKDSTKLKATKPFLFIIPFLIGTIAENFIPTRLIQTKISFVIGTLIFLSSLPFIIFALRELYKAKILFDATRASTTLITTSIYKISRNPVYLSSVLFYIGLSFIVNSIWMLVMVVPAFYFINKFSIEREEKLLEAKYGEEYRIYEAKVPRWL
jgi:protein-S-isoprenylcysteine O-methyltransferase Ste14